MKYSICLLFFKVFYTSAYIPRILHTNIIYSNIVYIIVLALLWGIGATDQLRRLVDTASICIDILQVIMAYDSLRKMSTMILIVTLMGSAYYWYFRMEEELYFTLYIGGSMFFLFLTLSFHRNRTKENAVLFSIIRHSKYTKKMITNDTSIKKYGMDDSLDPEGSVVFFTDNCSKVPKSNKNNTIASAGVLSAASVFFDMPFSEATELCCKKFRLDGTNKLKIISEGGIEYVKIINSWYTPGPYGQTIYVNGTELCKYDDICRDNLYNALLKLAWYVCMSLLFLIAIKIAGLLLRLFKTPIRVETSEYTKNVVIDFTDADTENNVAENKRLTHEDSRKSEYPFSKLSPNSKDYKNKRYTKLGNPVGTHEGLRLRSIKITKNVYISKFRLTVAIAYLISLAVMYNYANVNFKVFANAEDPQDVGVDTYSYYIDNKQVYDVEVLALLIKTSAIDVNYIKNNAHLGGAGKREPIDSKRKKRDTDNNKDSNQENNLNGREKTDFEKAILSKSEDKVILNNTIKKDNVNNVSIEDIKYLNESESENLKDGLTDINAEKKTATLSGTADSIYNHIKTVNSNMTGLKLNIKVAHPIKNENNTTTTNSSQKLPDTKDEQHFNTILDDIKAGNDVIKNEHVQHIIDDIYLDDLLIDEDSVVDLTCIYDEILYLTTGNMKAQCVIDKGIKGKIMIADNNTEYNVDHIDPICRSVYNINIARLGFPNCYLSCKSGKVGCKLIYQPNNNKNVPDIRLNSDEGSGKLNEINPTYEEFKIYLDTDTKHRVKKSVVDAKGNIVNFNKEKHAEYFKNLKMTIAEMDKRVQQGEDKAFESGIDKNAALNLGYEISIPASAIEGNTIDVKRTNAKDKLSKEGLQQNNNIDISNTIDSKPNARSGTSTPTNNNKVTIKDASVPPNEQEDAKVITVNMKGRITGFGEGTYVMDNYYTQFDDIFSGSVLVAERAELDEECQKTYGDRYKYAACTKGRRQVISCEPDLWGAFTFGNSFKCRAPTKFEGEKMPNWRRTTIKIDYTMPEKKMARSITVKDQQVSFNLGGAVVTGQMDISWGKSYQDNIQQVGGLKYFIYSFIVKLTVKSIAENSAGFVRLWDKEMTRINRWESRTFNDKYKLYKDGPMKTPNTVREIPDSIIDILSIEEPGIGDDMLQDKSRLNFILKADIYNPDMIKMKTSGQDCIPSPTKPCEYLIPTYYAIRLYGPAKIKVKVFNYAIEEVAFGKDVCSSVNAISVRNICYMFDETQSSTDVMVGGYPWTDMSAAILDRWKTQIELPSFYLNHPKVGAGQYLAKVSTTANIGFFSIKGLCEDTYYQDGVLMCDGSKAASIDMVEYSTFHRPLTSMPNCTIKKHAVKAKSKIIQCTTQDMTKFTVCTHNTGKHLLFKKDCKTIITKKLNEELGEKTGMTIKTPMVVYQFQQGKQHTRTKLHYIIECWHRSTIVVSILILLSGIGYVIFILHLLCVVFGYLNGYNLGRLIRKCDIAWIFGKRNTIRCNICNQMIFNEIEKNKHSLCCKRLLCPYCITNNADNKLCSLSFKNRNSYREHSKIHNNIRVNPYSGYIGVRRNKVVAFGLTPIQVIIVLFGLIALALGHDIPQDESGLRSNRVGTSINLDPNSVKCDNTKCSVMSSAMAMIPLVDGSAIVMRTKTGEKNYAKKYTIRNPYLKTSCTYEYSSPHIKLGGKRLVYCCKGKTECNSGNQDSMLQTPVGGKPNQPEFVPLDPSNPLKSLNCPKAVACKSPIVNFFWLSASCFSVDDGTAVGYEYYLPDIKKPMVSVFKCKITDMSYTVCDGDKCDEISGIEEDIEKGKIKFEHISQHLPVEFNIGAVSTVGEVKPDHIFYDLPNVGTSTSNTILSYKMNKIPQGDVCLPGSDYNDATCDINASGSSPNLNCKSTIPEPTVEHMSKQYESLSEVFHCNFEETNIEWTTSTIKRKVRITDKDFEDEQTYSWPSITLKSKNCLLGMTEIDLMSMGDIELDIVKYNGKIKSVKCEGYYNRNQKTRLTFILDKADGVLDFKCTNSFTDTCVFNTATTTYCNVTTLLPFKHSCKYNNDIIDIDCSGLEYSDADPTSGHSIGWTGSESLMTWPSSVRLMFTNWWGIGLLLFSIIFGIILVLWVIHLGTTMINANRVSMAASRKLQSHNNEYEHIVLDEDIYNTIIQKNIQNRSDGAEIRRRLIEKEGYFNDRRKSGGSRGSMFD